MITQLLTPNHIVIPLVVLLFTSGPRHLPETGRALGRSIREFTEAVTGHAAPKETLPGTGHDGGEPQPPRTTRPE